MRAADRGLFRDSYERDSCGFGLIAQLDDQPSHWLVKTAIASLNRLTHRGAVASDGKTGDGCGLLVKQPAEFLRALAQAAARASLFNTVKPRLILPRGARSCSMVRARYAPKRAYKK